MKKFGPHVEQVLFFSPRFRPLLDVCLNRQLLTILKMVPDSALCSICEWLWASFGFFCHYLNMLVLPVCI